MADPFNVNPGIPTGTYISSPDRTVGTSPGQGINIDVQPAGPFQVEGVNPELAAELNSYCNQTLNSIDRLRFTGDFSTVLERNIAVDEETAANNDERQGERATSANNLIAGDTQVKATEAEAASLRESLSVVSPEVLRYAQSRGIKVQVVHPGDDLTKMKVLRQQDPAGMTRQLPAMQKFTATLNQQVQERFGRKLAELKQAKMKLFRDAGKGEFAEFAEASGMSMGIGMGEKNPAIQKINDEIGKLEKERDDFIEEKVKESGLPIKRYSQEIFNPGAGANPMIQFMVSTMPASLEDMAGVHGAKTPEEKKEFMEQVKALNGDTLKKAQQEALQKAVKLETFIKDPEEKKKHQALIKDLREHPEKIPIDQRQHMITVPNSYYYHQPGAGEGTPAMRLDNHDYGSVQGWTDPDTGRVSSGKTEGYKNGIMGQYYYMGDVKRCLVRDFECQGGTPVHELGHAIDHLVEKDDPAFHKEWRKELEKAYEAVNKGKGGIISGYSRTNPAEYFAEGFSFYYRDPKLLKSKDPALYSLVEKIASQAAQLNRQGE